MKLRNGIIYSSIDWLIETLKFLSLVEFFKFLVDKIYPKDRVISSRIAVDIFIISKWVFLLIILMNTYNSKLITFIVWYLIITNIYTYFYYHAWDKEVLVGTFSPERIKRRFLSLLLAIGFNILSFTYLFRLPYSSNFKWNENFINTANAFKLSISNSLISGYESVKPITEIGHNLNIAQLCITFIFITIIISNSIPQLNDD